MKRVVVDHFGGPEVVKVVEDDGPRPGPGEVRVRVLAAGASFTDALIRAGTYLSGPKPSFTPGYELVGTVEELGLGCSRMHEGAHVGALTVWGADAERVCAQVELRLPCMDGRQAPDILGAGASASRCHTAGRQPSRRSGLSHCSTTVGRARDPPWNRPALGIALPRPRQ